MSTSPPAPLKPNRPHCHVWAEARTGRILYRLARPFWSRQAAGQWARRHYPDRETTIMKCERPECAPKLD